MTGRIFTGQNRSGRKGGQNETFKAVERRPATFDLGTRDCAFERVDQSGGNLPQILSSRQFTLGLGFTQAFSERGRPLAIEAIRP
jgi:hypothetical protein